MEKMSLKGGPGPTGVPLDGTREKRAVTQNVKLGIVLMIAINM